MAIVPVRAYRPPVGRSGFILVTVDQGTATTLARLAKRDIYPIVEFLRTGQCSVILEDNAAGLDRACEIVAPDHIAAVLPAMVLRVSRGL